MRRKGDFDIVANTLSMDIMDVKHMVEDLKDHLNVDYVKTDYLKINKDSYFKKFDQKKGNDTPSPKNVSKKFVGKNSVVNTIDFSTADEVNLTLIPNKIVSGSLSTQKIGNKFSHTTLRQRVDDPILP